MLGASPRPPLAAGTGRLDSVGSSHFSQVGSWVLQDEAGGDMHCQVWALLHHPSLTALVWEECGFAPSSHKGESVGFSDFFN